MQPDLTTYDMILVNTSAGKDSQAMLHVVAEQAADAGVLDRVVALHCDLGHIEWAGTRELAEEQARFYGVRFLVVKNRNHESLLTQVEQRGKWPGFATRYCTKAWKESQGQRAMTALVQTMGLDRRARILNCLGLRAAEGPRRRKRPAFTVETPASNKTRRQVDEWLPIKDWTDDQVWSLIRASGCPYHVAYDIGMPRLSCVFCFFADKPALMLAGKYNPELLAEYVAVEERIGHTFKPDLSLGEVKRDLDAGVEPVAVKDWTD